LPSQSEGSAKSNYSANRPRRWILRNKLAIQVWLRRTKGSQVLNLLGYKVVRL
jgi:hypothetical protein